MLLHFVLLQFLLLMVAGNSSASIVNNCVNERRIMVRYLLTFAGLMMFSVLIPGCGGGVEPGVADGEPTEEEEMQTEEEEAGEEEAAANSAGY